MGEVPRAGNDSGGGQLGNAIHCKPHGANDWLYIVVQEAVWDAARQAHRPRRRHAGPRDRSARSRRSPSGARTRQLLWTLLNKFAENYTKRELMAILNPLDVPCGPIMSTEDLANDEHVRGREMWVELDHPQRGKWCNVGMPIKLSASPAEIERSPLLGEHTDEVLNEVLGYDATTGRGAEERGRVLAAAEEGAALNHENRNHRSAGLRQGGPRGISEARRRGRRRLLRARERKAREARSAARRGRRSGPHGSPVQVAARARSASTR